MLLLFCGFTSHSADKTPAGNVYNLHLLVELAKKNNLVLKMSELDRSIAREEYHDIRALENPELEYSFGKIEIPGEPLKPDLWEVALKLPLPNPFHRYYFLKAAKSNISGADIEADITRREILKKLRNHFYKLRLYKKNQGFLEEKLRILMELNTITKAKVSIGEAKAIDALRASVEIQKVKTALFAVRKHVAHERTMLKEFLNYTLPEDFTITEDFPFSPLPEIKEALDRRLQTSPFIRLQSSRLDGAGASLNAAKLSIFEGIELFGLREKEAEGKKWKVGIGISIPLFNQQSAHVRKARLEKQKAQTRLEHARKHLLADVQKLLDGIRVLEKEIETFKGAILKESRENLDLAERLYKEGEVPLMLFLDAQNSSFEVQQRYYEAITEWNMLRAELEALLGGLK